MNTMYDKLLLLPLFQGLTRDDFTAIVGKTKLDFARHKRNTVLATAGDPCTRLIFLLDGEISACGVSVDESYALTEYSKRPFLLEPQSMYGLDARFVRTYTAVSEIQTVSIDKRYVLRELWSYDVFRLNLLNTMCSHAQRQRANLWRPMPDGVGRRIVDFISRRCDWQYGRKSLKIKMEDLAKNVSETRLNVSKTLNLWESHELVELRRGEIIVFDLKTLREEGL